VYTDEQFEKLEQEERELTDEAIAVMLLLMANLKGNIEKELRNFYQQYGKDGVVTYAEARKWISQQNHQRRLTALLLYLSGEFISALSDLEKQFRDFLINVIGKESTFFGIEVDLDDILTRKWGLDDLYWLERLETDVDLWKATIAKDIKHALHKGATLSEVLDRLDDRFKSIEYIMKKLGLTESTAVGSISRLEIFKELGIKKYQFFTKPDERRCETCGAMHGLVFPISAFEVGVTASPMHPHCRCWEVPIWD
jgi:SPP1 gp7 family putative phage head morphogenesis protein